MRRWLIGGLVMAVLLAAASVSAFWLVFVGIASSRNARVLARLRDVGYLLSEAADVFFSDTHGGFHGDGDMLLAFSCPVTCLDQLRDRVAKDYAPQIERAWTVGWSPYADANHTEIEGTIAYIMSGAMDERRGRTPDPTNRSILFLCGDKPDGPNKYCGNLFAIDYQTHRFWYLNIQT